MEIKSINTFYVNVLMSRKDEQANDYHEKRTKYRTFIMYDKTTLFMN